MEEQDIIHLWKTQETKIEQSLMLNKKLLQQVVNLKAQAALNSFSRNQKWGIVSFVIYLSFLASILGFAISRYSPGWNYFIISFAAIFVINVKGLTDYIRHMYLVSNINYEGSVAEIQEALSKLQVSIVQNLRTMGLQFPFWTTFFLSSSWFPGSTPWPWIVFQVIVTGSFTYLAYWLYKNQTVANLDKRWLRLMVEGSGGKSVICAMDFYKELEDFRVG